MRSLDECEEMPGLYSEQGENLTLVQVFFVGVADDNQFVVDLVS